MSCLLHQYSYIIQRVPLGAFFGAGNPLAVEKRPGSIAPLQAELWPFKEGNRQFYPKIGANVTDFVNHFQTCISQA